MDLERTDELPVLSEETLATMQMAATPDSLLAHPGPSVEPLHHLLESMEERWSSLEARLEARFEAQLVAQTETTTQLRAAIASLDQTLQADASSSDERRQDLERELRSKNLRIVELEAEMERRIAREADLERRIDEERSKTDELQERLSALNQRLEEASFAAEEPALEATRQTSRPSPLDLLEGEHASESIEASRAGVAELVCLTSDEPQRYLLDKTTITIGRAPDCDIHIPTHFVSRRHAAIRRENGRLMIEDQDSTNGIFVNAVRVQRRLLEDGDWVTIGETQFRFLGGESCE